MRVGVGGFHLGTLTGFLAGCNLNSLTNSPIIMHVRNTLLPSLFTNDGHIIYNCCYNLSSGERHLQKHRTLSGQRWLQTNTSHRVSFDPIPEPNEIGFTHWRTAFNYAPWGYHISLCPFSGLSSSWTNSTKPFLTLVKIGKRVTSPIVLESEAENSTHLSLDLESKIMFWNLASGMLSWNLSQTSRH